VDLLLDQAMTETITRSRPTPTSEEALVRQLMEKLDLDDMVDFCHHLTDNEDVQNWVEAAATADAGTSESGQKAAIAHFLTQQVGVERVERALASWPPRDEE
jgi:hypothetical protein